MFCFLSCKILIASVIFRNTGTVSLHFKLSITAVDMVEFNGSKQRRH